MKLHLKDKVMIMSGRDRGKTGDIIAVLPTKNQVVVEGLNTSKRHAKPTTQNPRGGINELIKPLDASKVAIIDPKSGRPARISYRVAKDGSKERIFTVSSFTNKKTKKAVAPKTESKDEATPKKEKVTK